MLSYSHIQFSFHDLQYLWLRLRSTWEQMANQENYKALILKLLLKVKVINNFLL